MKYDVIDNYYNTHETGMNRACKSIEDHFIEARDNNKIPLYMTRARIKNKESTYKKSKRKNKKKIHEVTDLIGIRLLCLFEQDIYEVYKYILLMFDREAYSLIRISVLGWGELKDEQESIFYRKSLSEQGIKFKIEQRKNGYKSIHLIGMYYDNMSEENFPFEIQLRTLLQDVWGELDHKLTYKKKDSNPFIQNSFIRLSKYLEANDMLLMHLKDIIDETKCTQNENIFSPGLGLEYEDDRLPNAFKIDGELYKEYQVYRRKNYGVSLNKDYKEAYTNFSELLSKFNSSFPNNLDDYNFIYWKEMEEAFFDINKNNFDNALKIYKKYLSDGSYVSAWRLGQINLHLQNDTKALIYFDNCLDLINNADINQVKIYINIAFSFWNLGGDYLSAAVKTIEEAISCAEFNPNYDNQALYNSACWYNMESCAMEDEQTICNRAQKYYDILNNIVTELERDNKIATRNTYDTLAWYNYQKYKKSNYQNYDYLQQAYEFMNKIQNGAEPIAQYISYLEIQDNHIHKINCDYNKHILSD